MTYHSATSNILEYVDSVLSQDRIIEIFDLSVQVNLILT
jgi:hypothetical protein